MSLQNEPCNKVGSGEAQAHEQVVPVSERAVHAVHPAGFENAARKEHHNEAAALRNIHEQGVRPPRGSQAFCKDTHVCEMQRMLGALRTSQAWAVPQAAFQVLAGMHVCALDAELTD